ncbi:ionotropic receptor 75a-like [Diorhabda sublineata]|uniref:ionotropic receptor 75a-like n=1 Tax=Diorhabda sublineata TaxID=1163346 RepID=UPI0024E12C6A|nr:ionotropic receptor 75a-like [Diorhabda sublineata]
MFLGSSIVPSRTGGRIIFLTLLIMSMMIYNYYTSSLVSSLLSNVPRPMKTIKELYESDLKVAIEPLPYLFSYILQHKDDRFISLLNRTKIYEKGVLNAATAVRGIEKVKGGTHAYLTELSTAFSCLADSDQDVVCDLADIIFIPFGDIGLVAQKRWQYTELFHITLRKILSSGIFRRIEDFWVSKRPKCLNKTRIKAVGVPELFLIYLIFVIGLIISLIIFLIESLLHKYR